MSLATLTGSVRMLVDPGLEVVNEVHWSWRLVSEGAHELRGGGI